MSCHFGSNYMRTRSHTILVIWEADRWSTGLGSQPHEFETLRKKNSTHRSVGFLPSDPGGFVTLKR